MVLFCVPLTQTPPQVKYLDTEYIQKGQRIVTIFFFIFCTLYLLLAFVMMSPCAIIAKKSLSLSLSLSLHVRIQTQYLELYNSY